MSIRHAIRVAPRGQWDPAEEVGAVSLDYDGRQRRRLRMTDDAGTPFMLNLSHVRAMGDGDGLALAEGGVLRVRAAPEPVADLTAQSTLACVRLAWHLGNRHTPVQVLGDRKLRIRADRILIDMARRLGADALETHAPFEPEPGAYGGGHGH